MYTIKLDVTAPEFNALRRVTVLGLRFWQSRANQTHANLLRAVCVQLRAYGEDCTLKLNLSARERAFLRGAVFTAILTTPNPAPLRSLYWQMIRYEEAADLLRGTVARRPML